VERSEDSLPPEYGSIIERIVQVNETLGPVVADALAQSSELPKQSEVNPTEAAEAPSDDVGADESPVKDRPA
jgi:hypothetical protein